MAENSDNNKKDYQYVMFVAEPNTSITIPFSEMCGNGIRSLGLHLFLESDDNHRDIYLTEGINIWTAAGVLKVQFKTIDTVNHQAIVEVKLGQFKFEMKNLFNFVSSGYFDNTNLTAINLNDYIDLPVNFSNRFGIGFTGEDNGEPHLALILNQTEFYDLIAKLRINNNDDLMALLRKTVSYLGNYFTFNYELFPHGINFNLGIIKNDKIFMSTHERNLVASKELCQYQYHRDGLCKCNTKACGTGGAVVANLTWLNYRFLGRQISTIHPGGEIVYQQKFNDTFMSGLTKKIC